ncbi:hypothetical protein LPJ61_004262 [Coemansia biformis]|uniref:TOG domain-containing protein n=1 Tax=Coemansia biformis TaxID=1286918 RepID=A0A9W7Y9M4_9FUNG|nr:hypothetical protein LPJ61_004262 [Coemansia biformis]
MDYTKCDSASDFEAKLRTLVSKLDVPEGEETWRQMNAALEGLVSLAKTGATKFEVFVPAMKPVMRLVSTAVISERTRLSATALNLVEELARQMELRFHPLCDLVFPSVMKTCGRANKVFSTRGVSCLTTVITYAHIPEQTPNICSATASDPNKTMRTSAAKLLMSIISCCTVPELTPHLGAVEKAISEGVVDANPDARTTARQSYEIYIKRFSDRVEQFHASLSSTAKKYLKIEDKGTASSDPAQSQLGASRQRQPLRDRILAQRANAKPAGDAPAAAGKESGGAGDRPKTGAAAPGPQRPKPVRPMVRPGPAAVRRDGTSAGLVPLAPNGAAAPSNSAPVELPAMGPKCSSLENVLMSPSSNKPTLARLFGEDTSGTAADAATDTPPHDSGHASVSPTASGPESRAASPGAKAEAGSDESKADTSSKANTSSKATPAASGDESAPKQPANKAAPVGKGAAKTATALRAKRGAGLSFSSLGGSAARATHAARPQSRNLVSSRMEEALRAQRPASRDAVSDDQRRMTLRSDSRRTPPGSRERVAAGAAPAGPGYLRATASSAQRVAGMYSSDNGE